MRPDSGLGQLENFLWQQHPVYVNHCIPQEIQLSLATILSWDINETVFWPRKAQNKIENYDLLKFR